MSPPDPAPATVRTTACCVVGGGPGGLMLGLLLARKGVPVVVLEAHKDLDRDFRGDTIHPSTLEALDQIGLADRLLRRPHGEMREMQVRTDGQVYTLARLSRLKTRFPFVAIMPQVEFLNFVADEARKHPGFSLEFGANVQRLIEDDGRVAGVRYRGADNQWHEVRATLTVAADGRSSRLRKMAGIEPVSSSPPMDVLWFRLPKRPGDAHDIGSINITRGRFIVLLEREHDWQVAYVFGKGGYPALKQGGIEALRRELREAIPWFSDRVEELKDWRQCSVLAVESSRCKKWYKPGLLLIGDAAHVMSPVGGVGINYAIQDAVEAANLLAGPLKSGRVGVGRLREFQRRREWPVKVIQTFQRVIQNVLFRGSYGKDRPFRPPLPIRVMLRLPVLRNLPGRMIAFGPKRVKVDQ